MFYIVIDCRNLTRPITGISRLIVSVVEALSTTSPCTFLLAPEPLHPTFSSLAKRSSVVVTHHQHYGIFARFQWGYVNLNNQVQLIKPDIFWAPAHRLSPRIVRHSPTILTIHDLVWKFAPETMPLYRRLGDRLLTGQAIKYATRVIAVSQLTADDLIVEYPHLIDKIKVVHNIVAPLCTPSSEHCLKQLGIYSPYVLFVGTLEPRKNLVRFVKAFLSLPKEIRGDIRFVIAGARGWLTGEIDRVLHDAEPDILVVGRVDEATLSRLYKNCAFLAMPSIYEGFGYPVIEAQQFGKRVLTSQGSSMAEIGGDTVVLVDPLNISSIAEGIKRCLAEDNSAISERAIQNANRFLPENIIPQLLAVFEEAQLAWKN